MKEEMHAAAWKVYKAQQELKQVTLACYEGQLSSEFKEMIRNSLPPRLVGTSLFNWSVDKTNPVHTFETEEEALDFLAAVGLHFY